jgi:hypothetical protein
MIGVSPIAIASCSMSACVGRSLSGVWRVAEPVRKLALQAADELGTSTAVFDKELAAAE